MVLEIGVSLMLGRRGGAVVIGIDGGAAVLGSGGGGREDMEPGRPLREPLRCHSGVAMQGRCSWVRETARAAHPCAFARSIRGWIILLCVVCLTPSGVLLLDFCTGHSFSIKNMMFRQ